MVYHPPRFVNLRLGHACNSSSTHSILVLPPKHPTPQDDTNDYDFGWDYFTAASRETKMAWFYFATIQSLSAQVGTELAHSIMKNEFGLEFPTDDWDTGYVDHDSVVSLPHGEAGFEYLKALHDVLVKDNVVVLGGNDNDDVVHPLSKVPESHEVGAYRGYGIEFPRGGVSDQLKYRLDGDMFTLYNPETGARSSVDFGLTPPSPRSPMLADIKVTGWCDKGCKACYQASTTDGVHGRTGDIYRVIDWLADNDCFEIALGGGEPTEHPDIDRIIARARYSVGRGADKGMSVSLTTRNIAALTDPKNWSVFSPLSGVAASTESAAEAERWIKSWPYRYRSSWVDKIITPDRVHLFFDEGGYEREGPALSIQVIDGLVSKTTLTKMHNLALAYGVRITVLGYKETGFGANVKPRYKGAWLEVFNKAQETRDYGQVGGVEAIDTVIAREYAQDLKRIGVWRMSVIDTEGVWSRYYDCTAPAKIGGVLEGPSSYCDEKEMKRWDPTKKTIPLTTV